MAVATLKLDANGKLDFSGGTLHVLTGSEAIVQGVRSRLRFFRGEWFADLSEGVPYWEKILVKDPNLIDIHEEFRKVIAESPGITAVESVVLDFNTTTRTLAVTWRATTIEQDTVTDVTELTEL